MSEDPGKHYVGHSPSECAAIRFFCEDFQTHFSDDCGLRLPVPHRDRLRGRHV